MLGFCKSIVPIIKCITFYDFMIKNLMTLSCYSVTPGSTVIFIRKVSPDTSQDPIPSLTTYIHRPTERPKEAKGAMAQPIPIIKWFFGLFM